jgi:beta-galactosidase
LEFTNAPAAACGVWADVLQPSNAQVLATYTNASYAGKAAITRNSFGKGEAMYIGADLDRASLIRVLATAAKAAGAQLDGPDGVEMTVRQSGSKRWVFLMNPKSEAQKIKIEKPGTDLLTGQARSGEIELNPYGVQVLLVS